MGLNAFWRASSTLLACIYASCKSAFNVSVATVFNYLKKYGIKTRPSITEKTKQKISEAQKKIPHRKGFHLSDEAKQKIGKANRGKLKNPSKYGGHRKQRTDGYIAVYCADHPFANKEGYVMEHILVMEEHIGRYITRNEVVHHKNHIRNDNRLENLQLMTFKEHAGLHMKERWEKKRRKTA